MDTKRIKANLKHYFEEKPEQFIMLAVGTITVATKFMHENTIRKNSKTWRDEVARREVETYYKHGKMRTK